MCWCRHRRDAACVDNTDNDGPVILCAVPGPAVEVPGQQLRFAGQQLRVSVNTALHVSAVL
jgi:hypothetical protein